MVITMNVLIVSDEDTKYGASNSLFYLVRELNNLGREDLHITVLLNKKKTLLQEKITKAGCKTIAFRHTAYMQSCPYNKLRLAAKYCIRGIQYLYDTTLGYKKIKKYIDFNVYDIVHCNSSRDILASMIAREYEKPLIWHIREFGDKDYECFSYVKNYVDIMNTTSDYMIAVSEAVKEHWIKKGIDDKKIIKIYNGVQPLESNYVSKHDCNDCYVRAVMVGSINNTKRQKDIVYAMAALPKMLQQTIRLDFVGDGSAKYIKEIKQLLKDNDLENNVRFLGYINEPEKVLYKYDLGIMCSKSEGFGRVTVEYMMAGLIVLASDSGANTELISDGVTGVLYKSGDIKSLSEKLIYILGNREVLFCLGERARIKALKMFNSKKNASEIYEVYQKCLKGNRANAKKDCNYRFKRISI